MTLEGLTRPIRFVAALVVLPCLVTCGDARRELVPVPVPDTATFEAGVRARLTNARTDFDRVVAAKPTDEQLANAYGTLAMAYHAQSLNEPAAAAYTNARIIAPRDKRWPYLLGQLYADSSKLKEAIAAFEAALAIDRNDVATQIFLGRAYLKDGSPDKARTYFEMAKSNTDARAAAFTGLGKAALAQGRYQEAIDDFEEALRLAPAAARLRQPLALAYRGLGDARKAEESLKGYDPEGFEPGIPDPIFDALNGKAASYRALLARAQYAMKAGRLDVAEQIFREAVNDDPNNASAVANLGITLANLGRVDEAQKWLTQAASLDASNASVHFSLGLLFDRQGQDQRAIDEYELASRHDSNNLQALVYRADAEMRLGRAQAATDLYREALTKSPPTTRIQTSLAMALVKAGRFAEAREALESALRSQPNNPDVLNALARVLATAPAASVRDGPRAVRMAKELYVSTERYPIVGQTYAMALAETGDFAGAVKLQRESLATQKQSGAAADAAANRNLALYQQRKPSREGWSPDDPLFQPRSPAARLIAKTP